MATTHRYPHYASFKVYVVNDTLEHATQAVSQTCGRLTDCEISAIGQAATQLASEVTCILDSRTPTLGPSEPREMIPDVVSGQTPGKGFLNLIRFFIDAIKNRNPFYADELMRIRRCALRLEGAALNAPRPRRV